MHVIREERAVRKIVGLDLQKAQAKCLFRTTGWDEDVRSLGKMGAIARELHLLKMETQHEPISEVRGRHLHA